jgi:hypothetical protein
VTLRERFLAVMAHQPVDRVPNWELGVWPQTRERWAGEGMPAEKFQWNWFFGEDAIGLDRREFVAVNMGMIPRFQTKVIQETDRYEIMQRADGRITRALKEGAIDGARTSMDEYLRFPVETIEDLRELKKRYDPSDPRRYPED